MASSSAGCPAESLAGMLSSGQYSDFIITRGDGANRYTFKAHRAILAARSEFFKRLCNNPLKEGITSTVDLPEDNPALIARLLVFMYTGTYSSKSLVKILPGVDLEQFGMVEDKFCCQNVDEYWWELPILHMNMFVLADKYGVQDLRGHAKERFMRCWLNRLDRYDFRHDENLVDNEESCDSDTEWAAGGNDKIIRALYNLPDLLTYELRLIVVTSIKWAIDDDKAQQNALLRASLREVSQFAADVAIFSFSKKKSKCANYSNRLQRLWGECACGSVCGCEKEQCKAVWRKNSFCFKCAAYGDVEYPEMDKAGS